MSVSRIMVAVHNRSGLHATTAALFCRTAKTFRSEITISYAGKEADAKRLLAVLSLDVGQGAFVNIEARGEDAQEAMRALHALITSRFGERE
jgi:phosphotransferase system HPr (HPr) family protein